MFCAVAYDSVVVPQMVPGSRGSMKDAVSVEPLSTNFTVSIRQFALGWVIQPSGVNTTRSPLRYPDAYQEAVVPSVLFVDVT
ncbi:MAG: hypothetical protein QG597_3132, partial [Actinomycetota bacterium]|nr:hypothetical protein [Actinomycetota bacterium]